MIGILVINLIIYLKIFTNDRGFKGVNQNVKGCEGGWKENKGQT
jgi:hypothetical protein